MEPVPFEYMSYSVLLEKSFSDQYETYEIIRGGSYGVVVKAYHRLLERVVAVKMLEKEGNLSLVENEVDIVKNIHHPHVIRMYQVIQGERYVHLVLELATNGDLLSWLTELRRCLYEDEARRFLKQIASAIVYLHQNRIAHRDLKPDNILLDEKGNAKVGDLGLSVRIAPGQLLTEKCGAFIFRAPELYLQEEYDGFKVDLWGLGTILFFMVTGKFPFKMTTYQQLSAQIINGLYEIPFYLTSKGLSILLKLLTVDPKQRPDIQQIMTHPWFDRVEEGSLYPHEPLPDDLDPTITTVMCIMGYPEPQIRHSVLQRAFDEVMAIYCMIKDGLKGETVSPVKIQPVPLYPTHTNLCAFPPQRRASLPTQLHSLLLPSERTPTCMEPQLERGKSSSLPPLALLPSTSSGTTSTPFQPDLVGAADCCSCLPTREGLEQQTPKETPELQPQADPQVENRAPRGVKSESQGCKGPGIEPRRYAWYGSEELSEEAIHLARRHHHVVFQASSPKIPGCCCFRRQGKKSQVTGQPQDDHRDSRSRRELGRTGVFGRIVAALCRLCCCLRCQGQSRD
ncbi:sperm motility kinase Z-like [Perognathus longimembris pacificus]|uniref:sperm motility kinase Z-like n=1 Tax=Perognathus longimembris pacificus TaxID=214514 RepID=UPI002019DABD|nr:sperm motility kinase Z-like [Perognathus longimembris pacificus]